MTDLRASFARGLPRSAFRLFTLALAVLATLVAAADSQETAAPRVGFVRTDNSPVSLVYHRDRGLVFATNPTLNRVEVISVAEGRRIATVPASQPVGVEVTADLRHILVGTATQFLEVIDPATLRVVERVPFTFIGDPSDPFDVPIRPVATSNGSVLVKAARLRVTGAALVQWRRAAGTFAELFPPAAGRGVGAMARSADHRRVLVASDDSGGGLDLYDAEQDAFVRWTHFGNNISGLAANHDGTRFAVILPGRVVVLDEELREIGRHAGDSSSTIFSADGRWLYVSDWNPDVPVTVLNVRTRTIGQVALGRYPQTISTLMRAIDETGRIFGLSDRGVEIIDGARPRTLTAPVPRLFGVQPRQLKRNAPPEVTIAGEHLDTSFDLRTKVLFDAELGTGLRLTTGGVQGISVTPPPAPRPGPVTVAAVFGNGWVGVLPDGLTYGPHVLYVDPSSGPRAGGTEVHIYGYGFAFPPGDVRVTFAGEAATVLGIDDSVPLESFPFPLMRLRVRTGPVQPGPSDLRISTPAGGVTVPRAFQYLRQLQIVTAEGPFAQILFDRFRRRLYLSKYGADRIDVYAVDEARFLSPLPAGHLPVGMALTPGGSHLAVANLGDNTVSLIHLEAPHDVQTVSLTKPLDDVLDRRPQRVATTSAGTVFIQMTSLLATGCVGALRELTIATLQVVTSPRPLGSCLSPHVFLANDDTGTRVALAEGDSTEASVALWNAGSDTWRVRRLGDFLQGVAISSDGRRILANLSVLDERLRVRAVPGVFDPMFKRQEGVAKLHATGSLSYMLTETGLDIWDGNHGDLRLRIPFPEPFASRPVAFSLDHMAVDTHGGRVFVLSESGFIVVELAGVPLSIGSMQPERGPRTGGTSVTIRGSGFQPGAVVLLNSVRYTARVLNPNTLKLDTAPSAGGPARVTVINPDGERYALDAGFRFDP
jgi:DNA-binding beta-propeller fold protein YncE